MSAGSYAYNLTTGECRLVIAVDGKGSLTFSGDHKWYSSKEWVFSVIPKTAPTKGAKNPHE